MFCTSCGSPLREDQKFCENCGAPVAQKTAPPHEEQAAPPTVDPNTGDVAILGCGFTLAARRYFEKYLTFKGRATRSEYWWIVLMNWAILIVANWLNKLLPGADVIISLALICPSVSLLIRREHDIGRSGTRILVGLIPLVGWIMLIVDTLKRSEGANRFGPAPVPYEAFQERNEL